MRQPDERLKNQGLIMTKKVAIVLFTATLVVSGCWGFRPGMALKDRPYGETLFSEPPIIKCRKDGCFLTWTQGTYPFFFSPTYQAMDGRLVFSLKATSSSGNIAGRRREVKIEGVENIQALKRGGAFWWEREPEPQGRLVPLKIIQ